MARGFFTALSPASARLSGARSDSNSGNARRRRRRRRLARRRRWLRRRNRTSNT